jgi:tRNA A-37 threonylcarbamoyl transferase component Bud32
MKQNNIEELLSVLPHEKMEDGTFLVKTSDISRVCHNERRPYRRSLRKLGLFYKWSGVPTSGECRALRGLYDADPIHVPRLIALVDEDNKKDAWGHIINPNITGYLLPYISGCTFEHLLSDNSVLKRLKHPNPIKSPYDVIKILGQLTDFSTRIKDAGVVHGDLWGSNLMITPDCSLFVIDPSYAYYPAYTGYDTDYLGFGYGLKKDAQNLLEFYEKLKAYGEHRWPKFNFNVPYHNTSVNAKTPKKSIMRRLLDI